MHNMDCPNCGKCCCPQGTSNAKLAIRFTLCGKQFIIPIYNVNAGFIDYPTPPFVTGPVSPEPVVLNETAPCAFINAQITYTGDPNPPVPTSEWFLLNGGFYYGHFFPLWCCGLAVGIYLYLDMVDTQSTSTGTGTGTGTSTGTPLIAICPPVGGCIPRLELSFTTLSGALVAFPPQFVVPADLIFNPYVAAYVLTNATGTGTGTGSLPGNFFLGNYSFSCQTYATNPYIITGTGTGTGTFQQWGIPGNMGVMPGWPPGVPYLYPTSVEVISNPFIGTGTGIGNGEVSCDKCCDIFLFGSSRLGFEAIEKSPYAAALQGNIFTEEFDYFSPFGRHEWGYGEGSDLKGCPPSNISGILEFPLLKLCDKWYTTLTCGFTSTGTGQPRWRYPTQWASNTNSSDCPPFTGWPNVSPFNIFPYNAPQGCVTCTGTGTGITGSGTGTSAPCPCPGGGTCIDTPITLGIDLDPLKSCDPDMAGIVVSITRTTTCPSAQWSGSAYFGNITATLIWDGTCFRLTVIHFIPSTGTFVRFFGYTKDLSTPFTYCSGDCTMPPVIVLPLPINCNLCPNCIAMGTSGSFVAPATGQLRLFFNDVNGGFWNNGGSWNVIINGITYIVDGRANGGSPGPSVISGNTYNYTASGFCSNALPGGCQYDPNGNGPCGPSGGPFPGTVCAAPNFGTLVGQVCTDPGLECEGICLDSPTSVSVDMTGFNNVACGSTGPTQVAVRSAGSCIAAGLPNWSSGGITTITFDGICYTLTISLSCGVWIGKACDLQATFVVVSDSTGQGVTEVVVS